MDSASYLTCSLKLYYFAVEAQAVQEIVRLPELSPVAEAPRYVAGLIDLRGKVVPVIDLNRRFGNPAEPYRLTDVVLILEGDGHLFGLLANAVHDVRLIADSEIERPPSYDGTSGSESRFIRNIARTENGILALLDLDRVLRLPDDLEIDVPVAEDGEMPPAVADADGFSPATTEERALYRERARSLRRTVEERREDDLIPLAVIGVDGEHFGVPLPVVREFTALTGLTPIPCCPPHILGCMNLRGQLVILLDIRGMLGLGFRRNTETFVMVVEVEGVTAGIVVDQVNDVVHVSLSEMNPLPSAAEARIGRYLKGTVRYNERVLSLLDLPKILRDDTVVVEEEV